MSFCVATNKQTNKQRSIHLILDTFFVLPFDTIEFENKIHNCVAFASLLTRMNALLFSRIANVSRLTICNAQAVRCIKSSSISFANNGSGNKNNDPAARSADDVAAEIEQIKKNEASYFANVKTSFDNLQASRAAESVDEKRSRLLYQSRKRGITENGLLLANFSAEHLPSMSVAELAEYDAIINNLHNEWDLYYWLTGAVPLPDEVKTNTVMAKMKIYCSNELKQSRYVQPDLSTIKIN